MGVPNNIIVPFVGVEFDASRASNNPADLRFKCLIFGHQDSADGTLTANSPTRVLNADDVAAKAGVGSLLHQMARRWFAMNKATEAYVIAVPQPTGVAQEFDITFAGTATANGEAVVYIDGVRFNVGVSIGDTATAIAAALTAEINKYFDRHCFTATSAAGVLTLTANYVGTIGGQHDIRTAYYDTDADIPGVTSAISVGTAGTGSADITNAIAGIAGVWFQVLVTPFNDTTNINLLETELATRFGPTVQQDGICYFGYDDTAANSITFATNSARNSPSMVMIDTYRYTEHPAFIASMVAAACAGSAENDPGQPLHRITLPALLPPIASEQYSLETLNTLTANGIMTLNPAAFGGPQTFGTVTMYLKNSSGIPDIAYQYQNTLFILMRLRYDFVAMITTKYARARLADSAERIRSGLQVITPTIGRAEAVALARSWEERGLVENIEQFKADIVCQRSTTNPNRLEWILPPDLVNQFIVGSADMQFRLQ